MSRYGSIVVALVMGVAALVWAAPAVEIRETHVYPLAWPDQETAMRPAPGRFLVARRTLTDPNFSRTVVLLVGYGADGALGIIVNRQTEQLLSDRLKEIKKLRKRDDALFFGGPVSTEELVVMIESAEPPEGSRPVIRDLHFGAGEELIAELVKGNKKKRRFRVYAGYAGWAPGQLDHEIEIGGWYVAPADAATVFSDAPDDVWAALISVLEAPPPGLRARTEAGIEVHADSQGRSQFRRELE